MVLLAWSTNRLQQVLSGSTGMGDRFKTANIWDDGRYPGCSEAQETLPHVFQCLPGRLLLIPACFSPHDCSQDPRFHTSAFLCLSVLTEPGWFVTSPGSFVLG